MAFNFEEFDTKRADELQPDRPIPAGTWKLKGTGITKKDAYTTANGKDIAASVSIGFLPVEPQEDVDADAVADNKWQGVRIWARRFIETEGDYAKFVELIGKLGVETEGRTPPEVFEAFGKSKPAVFAEVGVRTYTNRDGELVAENTLKNIVAA